MVNYLQPLPPQGCYSIVCVNSTALQISNIEQPEQQKRQILSVMKRRLLGRFLYDATKKVLPVQKEESLNHPMYNN